MHFNLIEIVQKMDLFALSVVVVLGVMGVATLAVFLERLWSFRQMSQRSREYGAVATAKLTSHDLAGLRRPEAPHERAPLAVLVAAGVEGWVRARDAGADDAEAVEFAGKALARRRETVAADVNRGMTVLASVGSVSPFVGLLGTVVGIIAAFQGIASEGSGGLGAVSGGIAEALVVTALGLCIAIPAVLGFNFLSGRADRLLLALDQGAGELLDHLRLSGRRAAPDAPSPETRNGRAHPHVEALRAG